ncbi:MAG TPA: poly-beta-hydroxybutyrate polymerase N-terminal domain-containing protein, partial [Sinorhizobium sp.]|nr:poly-beta-hydroxybutyrate polymerase N-terminal domain-containing protein [Sinorhizobium sp.]
MRKIENKGHQAQDRNQASPLTEIRGIGQHLAAKLQAYGISTIEDLAAASEADLSEIEQDLDFKGRIARDYWIGQAKELLERKRRRAAGDGQQQPRRNARRRAGIAQPPDDAAEANGLERWLSTAPPEFCPEYRAPLPRRTTHALDRAFKAQLARASLSVTPAGLAANTFDWLAHLAISPGKQFEVLEHAAIRHAKFMLWLVQQQTQAADQAPCVPLPDDDRFDDPRWRQWPFNLIHQSFLLVQEFWQSATTDVEGLSPQEENALSFTVRQILDHFSPSNFVATNPEVLQETLEQGGMNLFRGAQNAMEDWQHLVSGRLPVGVEDFQVGK